MQLPVTLPSFSNSTTRQLSAVQIRIMAVHHHETNQDVPELNHDLKVAHT